MAKASRQDAHRPPTVSPRVQLTTRQRTCLEQILRRQTSPQRLVRRAKMLLARETGAKECHVMRQMPLNRGTGRAWRQRGLACAPKLEPLEADEGSDKTLYPMIVAALTDPPRPGTPAPVTAEQIVQMVAGAGEDPTDSGRPVSHWAPREVAEEVRTRGMVATISPRSVGRFFQSGRLTASSRGIRAQREAG
jgi:putative transposase